ncbi:MAG: DUF6011 domain-containing protein [Isosphaeraceae bacterium]
MESFRQKMRSLFAAMLEHTEPPYVRRPTASRRLICDTVPASKLIVHRGWTGWRAGGILNLDRIDCELLQERVTTVHEQPVRKFDRKLTFRVTQNEKAVNLIRSFAVDDVLTAIGTMEEFLSNPSHVLARSHDNCCYCGKGLRDELSGSRGIGPECIKTIGFLVYGHADWNALVQWVVDV